MRLKGNLGSNVEVYMCRIKCINYSNVFDMGEYALVDLLTDGLPACAQQGLFPRGAQKAKPLAKTIVHLGGFMHAWHSKAYFMVLCICYIFKLSFGYLFKLFLCCLFCEQSKQ